MGRVSTLQRILRGLLQLRLEYFVQHAQLNLCNTVVALVAMAIFKQADQSFQLFETNVTRRSLGRGQAIICTTI